MQVRARVMYPQELPQVWIFSAQLHQVLNELHLPEPVKHVRRVRKFVKKLQMPGVWRQESEKCMEEY